MIRPSYETGFARSPGESAYPQDWEGLVGAWDASLGYTGPKVFDLSVNDHQGTFSGAGWVMGQDGFEWSFDGTSDFVSFGNILNTFYVNPYTISMLLNTASNTNASIRYIFSKSDGASSGGGFLLVQGGTSAGQNQIIMYHLDGAAPSPSFKTTALLPLNQDVRLTITWNGTTAANSIKIYFNGVRQAGTESNYGTIAQVNALDLRLGTGSGASALCLIGTVRNLLLHDRVLPQTEIINLGTGSLRLWQQREMVPLVIVAGALIEMVGTADSQSALTGTLDVSHKLVGTADGQSVLSTSSLTVSRKLISTVDGLSAIANAALTGTWSITGTIAGSAVLTGSLFSAYGLSDYTELKILDHIVGKTSFEKPTIAIALCIADPGETGTGDNCHEVANTNGYERVALIADDWNAAASGQIDNANAITFPEATGSWGTVTHYVLVDSPTYGQGNVLVHDVLDTPKSIIDDEIVKFAVGQLKFALN